MTEYTLYDRDLITGHLKAIAVFESSSDFKAAGIAKKKAAGRSSVLYQEQRSILHFKEKRLRLIK